MPTNSQLPVVVDTNVVMEGLTKPGSAASLILNGWLAGLFQVHVCDALAYEYVDVLSRKLSPNRWQQLKPMLGKLLAQSYLTTIYYSWRPISPDPGDEHVIDCAMNANAILVTSNIRDFQMAKRILGLRVMKPLELLNLLN